MSPEQFESRMTLLRTALLRKRVPKDYAARLLEEVGAHYYDCRASLIREGASETEAQAAAFHALGPEKQIVEAAVRELRRGNLIGRHRVFCLVIMPLLVFPFYSMTFYVIVFSLVVPTFYDGLGLTHPILAAVCKWCLEGLANLVIPIGSFWFLERARRTSYAGAGFILCAQILVGFWAIFTEISIHLPSPGDHQLRMANVIPLMVLMRRFSFIALPIWFWVYLAFLMLSVVAARRRAAHMLAS